MFFAERLGVPIRDRRFWVIQVLILAIDIGHTILEGAHVLVGTSEFYLLSVSAFLIPVVYAGLVFGMRGAVPTAVWALVLSLPEISQHDAMTRAGIGVQFAIILAIAIIVALRVDRERAATEALEAANRTLSRLNATASAVAGSLELDDVLDSTLHAAIDPRRSQVMWIRLVGDVDFAPRTDVASSRSPSPSRLDPTQEALTLAACQDRPSETMEHIRSDRHTIVAPLRSEGRTFGAIGTTQPDEAIAEHELPVIQAIADQLGVALNNISSHQRSHQALSALKAANDNLEIYVALATDAQEEERKRLSRELHDDILQALVVAKGQIEAARTADLTPFADHRLLSAQHVLEDAVVNVRRYCRALRPSLLDDLGLVDAVDWLVSDLRSRTGLTVQLETTGHGCRLDSRDELLIFRVVQEALHNVERHAHATTVRVLLVYDSGSVTVEVIDDGCGMRTHDVGGPVRPGLGLRGMDERAKLLRATLTIESTAGVGTEVVLRVPIAPRL